MLQYESPKPHYVWSRLRNDLPEGTGTEGSDDGIIQEIIMLLIGLISWASL